MQATSYLRSHVIFLFGQQRKQKTLVEDETPLACGLECME